MGSVAKSYMRKSFLIYEEMRKYLVIYVEAISHIRLCNCSRLNFLIYEENFIFFLTVLPPLLFSFLFLVKTNQKASRSPLHIQELPSFWCTVHCTGPQAALE
jgi:hypothetical protein